jgi:predicted deacylase
MRESFEINGEVIKAGERKFINLPVPRLNSSENASMPVHVLHARQDGPRLFVSAAIHGDELNGTEIIRRLLAHKSLKRLRGTLVVIPVVNVYGLVYASRYMPDRRDLNRSFPGSEKGSLTARVANLFMTEVVKRCTHGIDLHTGAIHRTNLPQIRANLDDSETENLARAFGVPVMLNSAFRDGSLRECAAGEGVPMLLYEAGEALRYDELSIRIGLQGVLNVMRELGMLAPLKTKSRKNSAEPFVAYKSQWMRASETGMLRTTKSLGASVEKGEILGYVDDPYNNTEHPIEARVGGVIIGRAQSPLVHEGDAVFHIARFRDDFDEVGEQVNTFHEGHSAEPEQGIEPSIV